VNGVERVPVFLREKAVSGNRSLFLSNWERRNLSTIMRLKNGIGGPRSLLGLLALMRTA